MESIKIGSNSFTMLKYPMKVFSFGNKGGICRIENCPKLRILLVDNSSFSDYDTFELANLPSLESIEIGDQCFVHAPVFSLSGPTGLLV